MNRALLDFDGTITDRDTFTNFLRLAVRPLHAYSAQVISST